MGHKLQQDWMYEELNKAVAVHSHQGRLADLMRHIQRVHSLKGNKLTI